jgi:hypothetical protein
MKKAIDFFALMYYNKCDINFAFAKFTVMHIGITYENLAIFAHSLKYSQSKLACEQTS